MEILKGKIALITGASGGIGSCIARRFAQDGISLALLGRSKEKLAATAASVREYGVETLFEGDKGFLQMQYTQLEWPQQSN